VKILLVCYSYFPELSPRAFRWTAIAEELVRLDHQVVVICGGSTSRADFECVNGVEIHRTGSNARELVKRWFNLGFKVDPTHPSTIIRARVSIKGWLGKLVKSAYNHTLSKIIWPDFAALWYFSALKKAIALQKNRSTDVLVTVSLPYSGHLIGYSLKRRFEMRWVVDIGDPFSFMTETPVNNTALFRGLNAKSESSVLALADMVTVTTKETRFEYLKYFPNLEQTKIVVVPPLFSPPKSVDCLTYSSADSNKIRLVFAGTLYKSIRNPGTLLRFFQNLLATSLAEQLELHFYGVMNDCHQCFNEYVDLIDSKVFIHGLVPREQAVRAMQNATVLVNIGNATDYQLPSKVVEYVMMGKPVLNVTKLYLDSSQSFFSNYGGVCNVAERDLINDSTEFERVKHFVENPPAIDTKYIEQLSRTHSTQSVTQNYLALFKDGNSKL